MECFGNSPNLRYCRHFACRVPDFRHSSCVFFLGGLVCGLSEVDLKIFLEVVGSTLPP